MIGRRRFTRIFAGQPYYLNCRGCGKPLDTEPERLAGYHDTQCQFDEMDAEPLEGLRIKRPLSYRQNVAAGRRLVDA